MVYAYVRVSTEHQTLHVQHYELQQFAFRNNLTIDKFIEEKVSGTVKIQERELDYVVQNAQNGDVVICTEVSRLGRSMQNIFYFMDVCIERGITIMTMKENYILKDDPQTKFILSVYSFAAEIERDLIRRRTKEALEAKKRAGVKLGRPVGSKSKNLKLDKYQEQLIKMLKHGIPKQKIAKALDVNKCTIYKYCRKKGLECYL